MTEATTWLVRFVGVNAYGKAVANGFEAPTEGQALRLAAWVKGCHPEWAVSVHPAE